MYNSLIVNASCDMHYKFIDNLTTTLINNNSEETTYFYG